MDSAVLLRLHTRTLPSSFQAFNKTSNRVQVRQYSAPLSNAIPAAKQKYVPSHGTYPKGFLASGTHVGVKASNKSFPDLCIIASDRPCSAAAVFTTNKFQAAPVVVSRNTLLKGKGEDVRAIVVNSGCANAVTGKGGMEDAEAMGSAVDQCIASSHNGESGLSKTLVMSTGVIGQRLPIKKILDGIPTGYKSISSTHDSWMSAAKAICTTDTFPKLLSRSFSLPSSSTTYHLAGMTKGAGMIHPNMATLLGILCTDVPIAAPQTSSLLKYAVSRSFNCISVDGDTSTNDTLCLLANGAAGGKAIDSESASDYEAFSKVLADFAADLAKLVVRDGEGATKFVTIRVINAVTEQDAKKVASTIARSPLVKTALYGKDANWGRILCATGYADGVDSVVPEKTSVSFVPTDGSEILKLLVNGEPEKVDEERAAQILEPEDLEILVNLGGGVDDNGTEESVYWTCDFSHEYITINGDYRT